MPYTNTQPTSTFTKYFECPKCHKKTLVEIWRFTIEPDGYAIPIKFLECENCKFSKRA